MPRWSVVRSRGRWPSRSSRSPSRRSRRGSTPRSSSCCRSWPTPSGLGPSRSRWPTTAVAHRTSRSTIPTSASPWRSPASSAPPSPAPSRVVDARASAAADADQLRAIVRRRRAHRCPDAPGVPRSGRRGDGQRPARGPPRDDRAVRPRWPQVDQRRARPPDRRRRPPGLRRRRRRPTCGDTTPSDASGATSSASSSPAPRRRRPPGSSNASPPRSPVDPTASPRCTRAGARHASPTTARPETSSSSTADRRLYEHKRR